MIEQKITGRNREGTSDLAPPRYPLLACAGLNTVLGELIPSALSFDRLIRSPIVILSRHIDVFKQIYLLFVRGLLSRNQVFITQTLTSGFPECISVFFRSARILI